MVRPAGRYRGAQHPPHLIVDARQLGDVFLSRLGALDRPDQVVFDLDPPDEHGFGDACRHALDLRELLEGELGLTAYVKTTGGKGLHVHVPVRADEDFDSVRGFARDAAALLVTVIAPYAVRARRGAPVATPLDWAELSDSGLSARRFALPTMADRLAASADPWAGMARHRHGLAGPRRRFEALRAGVQR